MLVPPPCDALLDWCTVSAAVLAAQHADRGVTDNADPLAAMAVVHQHDSGLVVTALIPSTGEATAN